MRAVPGSPAPDRNTPPRSRTIPDRWLLLALAGIALALRVWGLSAQSLWLDEATSLYLALMDVGTAVRTEANGILYSRLLALWMRATDGEGGLRLFSVAWSVATVPVVYRLGTHLFGRAEGLIAALLLTVNAFHVAYAQEVRAYSQAAFLVTLASLWFAEGLLRPSAGRWAAYGATAAAAVYSHAFAVLVLPAHAVSLLFLPRREVPWRGSLAGLTGAALLAAPALWLVAGQGGRQAGWLPQPDARSAYAVVEALAGTSLALVLAYAVGVGAMVWAAGREWSREEASWTSWRYAFPLTWLIVPAMAAYGIATYAPVLPRYLLFCVPALALTAAAGFARARPPATAAAVLLVTVLALARVAAYYCCAPKEQWREASALVLSQAAPGDAIFFYSPYIRPAFEYYRMREARRRPVLQPEVLAEEEIGRSEHWRVWLVLSHDETVGHTASRRLRDRLAARYPGVRTHSFVGVEVVLYSK